MAIADPFDAAVYEILRENLQEFQSGRSSTPTIAYDNVKALLKNRGFGNVAKGPLEDSLGRIARCCLARGLRPISALAVGLNPREGSSRQLPGLGYFAVVHPTIHGAAEQLGAWREDLAQVQNTTYPDGFDL